MSWSPFFKKLAALLFGLIVIVCLELALSLVGISPLSQEDRFVGFSNSAPLFVETSSGHYALNQVKKAYFNRQSFSMPKPAGVFRIITLGGSTTYGRPYLQQTAFGNWLKKLLERYGNTKVEIINAGGISYASYRVHRLMKEMVKYQPDLMIVYSGHNEFLEARNFSALKNEPEFLGQLRGFLQHSRIYSSMARLIGRIKKTGRSVTTLPEGVSATIEQIGGPELYHRDLEFRTGVIEQYRYELEEMTKLSQQHGIPLILCTLPVNLSGISPFKSEHRSNLSVQQLESWDKDVAEGERGLAEGQFEAALQAFQRAGEIDDQYALLSYRMGQALEALGQVQQAYAAYDRAREEDIVPLRALNEFNDQIRKLATRKEIPLADVESFYRRISPGGIPGPNLFDDHVHPTVEGQQVIAWTIMNVATENGLVPLSAQRWQQKMVAAKQYLQQEVNQLPTAYLARGQWGVGRLYFWAGKHEEAYQPLLNAWQSIRNEPEIPLELGQIELSRGRSQQALSYFDAALRLTPGDENIILNKAIAEAFSGSTQSALNLLAKREWSTSILPRVWLARGQALMMQNQLQQGLTALRKAVDLAPNVATLHLELVKGLTAAGRRDEARHEYRSYLELSNRPDVEAALVRWEKQLATPARGKMAK